MQKNPNDIVIFLIVISAIILCMVAFIVFMLLSYRKRQIGYSRNIEQLKLDNERTVLCTQLEIQEQTFQNISREIHDNISLSLTLAKLHLNTLDWNDKEKSSDKIESSINLLSQSIASLSDISKSLNADIIIQQGLLKAIEGELQYIRQVDIFNVDFELAGTPVYLDNQKELIIFRIVQEAFNNIIKHSSASNAKLFLKFNTEKLILSISDDGKGFETERAVSNNNAGLKNMEARIKMLNGHMQIKTEPGMGTILSFNIPF